MKRSAFGIQVDDWKGQHVRRAFVLHELFVHPGHIGIVEKPNIDAHAIPFESIGAALYWDQWPRMEERGFQFGDAGQFWRGARADECDFEFRAALFRILLVFQLRLFFFLSRIANA